MGRSIAIIGAPSAIGIKPYDDGAVRRLDLAPGALREEGVVARLGARDLGDVVPPPYREMVRAPGKARNEAEVLAYAHALAGWVAGAARDGAFLLVLGGDCSIVLGCLLGLRRAGRGRVGLAYVDAHTDFATPEESLTGSPASMCLAQAVGRGETPLARLGGGTPLVRPDDVALIARRDDDEPWYGHDALRASSILDLTAAALCEQGIAAAVSAALERIVRPELDGYWVHVDADAFDPSAVPAVDSPLPGGPDLDEMAELVAPLVRHPKALGMELTIYDPGLDPERSSAKRLADFLERVLGGSA